MLFLRDHRNDSARHQKIHALFEIAYTLIDFAAASLFVVGSVMFLSDAWQHFGTWLFILGSIFFALKPTIRMARELRLAALGNTDDLAKKVED